MKLNDCRLGLIAVCVVVPLLVFEKSPAEAAIIPPPMSPQSLSLFRLSDTIDSFTCDHERLEDVFARLGKAGRIPMDVRWNDLGALGVSKDSRITCGSSRGTLSHVLTLLLASAEKSAGNKSPQSELSGKLRFEVRDDGTVLITSGSALFSYYVSPRVYDLADKWGPGGQGLGVNA